MTKSRKRSSSSAQVYDSAVLQSTPQKSSAGEESEGPERKRIKLVDFLEVLPPSQVHPSPPDFTERSEILVDGKSRVICGDGFEVTVKIVMSNNELEYISTQSSRVSQANKSQQRNTRKSSLHQKNSQSVIKQKSSQTVASQLADDGSKDTSVSSGRKRLWCCSRPVNNVQRTRWSVSIEEEEERKTKRRRTKDVERVSSILSRYKIGKKLGEGGFGIVYKGRRLEDGLQVAIKITKKGRNLDYIKIPGHPSPLPLEVALLMLASNPKVPEIIELLEWEDLPGQFIMVMERPSPCEDLSDFIEGQGGVLKEDVARVIMGQAAYAAYMCCQRGVFHRDMKPGNFLVNPKTLDVKLIDFGCGARMKESAYTDFCGTPDYFPPEYKRYGRYHAKPATAWSLGMTLFRMVCGRRPDYWDWQDISRGRWYQRGLSKECGQLICSLLQKDRHRRMELDKILLHSWFK